MKNSADARRAKLSGSSPAWIIDPRHDEGDEAHDDDDEDDNDDEATDDDDNDDDAELWWENRQKRWQWSEETIRTTALFHGKSFLLVFLVDDGDGDDFENDDDYHQMI